MGVQKGEGKINYYVPWSQNLLLPRISLSGSTQNTLEDLGKIRVTG
jgi:hypothetical protein